MQQRIRVGDGLRQVAFRKDDGRNDRVEAQRRREVLPVGSNVRWPLAWQQDDVRPPAGAAQLAHHVGDRGDCEIANLIRVRDARHVDVIAERDPAFVDCRPQRSAAVVQREKSGELLQRGTRGRGIPCKSPGDAEQPQVDVLANEQSEVPALRPA